MKSKKYGRFTVLIPDNQSKERLKEPIVPTDPIIKNLVYKVRIDDEAYLEITLEDLKTQKGIEKAVNVYARKTGDPRRRYIASILSNDLRNLDFKDKNTLTDESVMAIYRRFVEQEEELFWLFYSEQFGQSDRKGNC